MSSNGSATTSSDGLGMHELDEFMDFAATIIQSRFRGHLQRKRFLSQVKTHKTLPCRLKTQSSAFTELEE